MAINAHKKREHGYTLIEMLATLSVSAILLTLGASALRTYWLTQSLETAEAETVAQMRNLQERAVSESNPRVYGMRFRVGTSEWGLILFNGGSDPGISDDVCNQLEIHEFDGVTIEAASFAAAPVVTSKCSSEAWATTSDRFVFFYPRGTATAGEVTLHQPSVNKRTEVEVSAMTGRVKTP